MNFYFSTKITKTVIPCSLKNIDIPDIKITVKHWQKVP